MKLKFYILILFISYFAPFNFLLPKNHADENNLNNSVINIGNDISKTKGLSATLTNLNYGINEDVYILGPGDVIQVTLLSLIFDNKLDNKLFNPVKILNDGTVSIP